MNILFGLDDIVGYYSGDKERYPTVYILENYVEQVPNPDSRVGLARRRDALGLNRATLRWQLSELDKIGIRTAHQVIAAEVGRTGFGRMRIEMPEEEEVLLAGAEGGPHHMGTTRMHDDPRRGVVDADCRIHGLKNAYIAGSSVFPTGGYINPTLTIVEVDHAMPLSSPLSRRWGLAAVATFTIAGLARLGVPFARPAPKSPEPLSSVLQRLEPSRNSARSVGRVYLAQRPRGNETPGLTRSAWTGRRSPLTVSRPGPGVR
jgi:hypothetical protein